MEELTFRERELVALGAALGSNCAPCVEHHVGEARKAGLSDGQIASAIALADSVRKVPAAKALNAASALLGAADAGAPAMACGPGMASKPAGCCS